MVKDIDKIIQLFRSVCPDMQVEQLVVRHPADDDGLWFFTHPGREMEVQLESSYGNCPFLIESDAHGRSLNANTIEEAVQILQAELSCP